MLSFTALYYSFKDYPELLLSLGAVVSIPFSNYGIIEWFGFEGTLNII